MSWYKPADVGFAVRGKLADFGYGARLFVRLLALFGASVRRFSLVRDQIHFLGNYSLAIITVSGLFVGFVLGLQGYYTLQRYGSSEALGLLVALSLVRELGPVVTALLFAGRAGTSLTAEIGLMKAGEQLSAMEMMAVDPVRRILAPRFWAGVIVMPLLAAVFSAVGIVGGWVVGVLTIGIDPGGFWSQMQGGVDVWRDVGNGVLKSVVFGFTVTFVALLQGLRGAAHARGRFTCHHPHGGGGLAGGARVGFHPDRADVQYLICRKNDPMQRSKNDFWVGLFVLIGAAAVLFLALQSANLLSLSFQSNYRVTAKFDNIGGLKPKAAVKSAGVVVGRVESIVFDDKSFQARVTLAMENRYAFPKDSSLKILTSGLLGEQYIGIEAGADAKNLAAGDNISTTQSAVVLENLISQFLYSKAAEGPSTPAAGTKK